MNDYLEQARAALASEDAIAAEARLQQRAAAMREVDERDAVHKRLCEQHGLPLTSTPRQVADACIAYDHKWRSFITCRYSGSATAAQIISPESAPDHLRADFQARRDRLRAEFEKQYAMEKTGRAPDPRIDKVRALAERPGTDGEGQAAQAALERIGGAAA